MQRIGVFICWCGSNIAATVDVVKVAETIKNEPGVVFAANYQYMCSENGQQLIKQAIKEHNLTAPMVAGWKVTATPTDKLQIARMIRRKMESADFDALRTKDWFTKEEERLLQLFNE